MLTIVIIREYVDPYRVAIWPFGRPLPAVGRVEPPGVQWGTTAAGATVEPGAVRPSAEGPSKMIKL